MSKVQQYQAGFQTLNITNINEQLIDLDNIWYSMTPEEKYQASIQIRPETKNVNNRHHQAER